MAEIFPQAALGFRAWRVGPDNQLLAAHVDSTWKQSCMTADCKHYDDHQPPEPGCRCGVHAYYTLSRAQQELSRQDRLRPDAIIGIVAGRGEVACHHHGWRASECQILGLLARKPKNREDIVETASADAAIAEHYRVPLFSSEQELLAHANRSAAAVPKGLRPPPPPWWRNTETAVKRMRLGAKLFVAYMLFLIALLVAKVLGVSDSVDTYARVFFGSPLQLIALGLLTTAAASGMLDEIHRYRIRQRCRKLKEKDPKSSD